MYERGGGGIPFLSVRYFITVLLHVLPVYPTDAKTGNFQKKNFRRQVLSEFVLRPVLRNVFHKRNKIV